ncbi:MAG: EAL domain-containing protein, partial [Clostridia bacterium]|nr:EAL domain-containing protein [Clostridia bacterium]
TVAQLRETGFKIEMDDFGSGYSSLNMLTAMPIDALKLDMRFVRHLTADSKDIRMVQLMVDIAGFLSVPVIAEGVETEEQVQLLRECGCDVVQGYYFSKPVPADDFEKFITREKE